MDLKGKSFITLLDFAKEEIEGLLDLASKLKEKKRNGVFEPMLEHKNIALVFEKTSTRTRCAFEVAAYDEGAHVTYLDPGASQMGKKESIADTARVLGRFYDAIEFRGFSQASIEALVKHSQVPVYNGLTDIDHPTQLLADLLTMKEKLPKPLEEAKVVFAGDIRNNMSLSWIGACALFGMHFVGYGPKELAREVPESLLKKAKELSMASGAIIEFSQSPSCLDGADAIYTDIWASMGEEELMSDRVKILAPYRVTREMLDLTKNPNVLFMHCLPSFHDLSTETALHYSQMGVDIREVDDEVFESTNSVVFDESENRLHTIKAVMVATLSDVWMG
ncbi:MAG: ornithine carbamoyltransferase [Eubacteriaceae bacterium]|jgi:ornithine carbamoyltransferase|nr:ornithine carbamoyltransferase [Eubacteriaceae bacterium]